jgi:amino acid permease
LYFCQVNRKSNEHKQHASRGTTCGETTLVECPRRGYHKAMGNRQVQMIAIGGAIGTGLFLGAGARLQMAGPALALVYLVCGIFRSLYCARLANWFYIALPAAALSPMPVNF